jgi:hypothetical protein
MLPLPYPLAKGPGSTLPRPGRLHCDLTGQPHQLQLRALPPSAPQGTLGMADFWL